MALRLCTLLLAKLTVKKSQPPFIWIRLYVIIFWNIINAGFPQATTQPTSWRVNSMLASVRDKNGLMGVAQYGLVHLHFM